MERMRRVIFVALLLLPPLILSCASRTQAKPEDRRIYRVAVPVADLRREPVAASPALEQDLLEESQLLYGDPVEILEEKDGWAWGAARDQMEFNHNNRWEGYPGWIESSSLTEGPVDWKVNLVVTSKWGIVRAAPSLSAPIRFQFSIGTRLVGSASAFWWKLELLDGTSGWIEAQEVTSLEQLSQIRKDPVAFRKRLVETARLFLGDPYYWGGRSAHHTALEAPPHTAADCSGLTGLIYQANGLTIPRDAHEQWMKARSIPEDHLSPGDLIFLFDPNDSRRVNHVMLYIGEGLLIEGPGTGKVVRQIGLKERLKEAAGRRIAFGSYLW